MKANFRYDINATKIDKTSSRNLFLCHSMSKIIKLFCSTFLIAYIYSFSIDTFDYIKRVSVFYLAVYGTYLLTNWLFSLITDNTNRIWVYRASIIVKLIFVLVIIFYGKNLANMLILSGILYGISESCYYSSYNVLKQEMVSRKIISKYSIFSTICETAIDIILPFTLGALIQISNYTEISIYIAVIVSIMLVLSFFIKSKKPYDSKYSIPQFIKKLKANPQTHKKVKFLFFITFIYGLTTAVKTTLNICIMLQFNSTMSLGGITSIIGAITIVELLLINKFTKPAKRNYLYIITAILPIISSIIFIVYPSMATIIIFNLLSAGSRIFFGTFYEVCRNGILKEAGLYSEIAEYEAIVEDLFAWARVISFSILMLVGLSYNATAFNIMLIILTLSYTITAVCVMIFENRYTKFPEVNNLSEKQQEKNFQKVVKNIYKIK